MLYFCSDFFSWVSSGARNLCTMGFPSEVSLLFAYDIFKITLGLQICYLFPIGSLSFLCDTFVACLNNERALVVRLNSLALPGGINIAERCCELLRSVLRWLNKQNEKSWLKVSIFWLWRVLADVPFVIPSYFWFLFGALQTTVRKLSLAKKLNSRERPVFVSHLRVGFLMGVWPDWLPKITIKKLLPTPTVITLWPMLGIDPPRGRKVRRRHGNSCQDFGTRFGRWKCFVTLKATFGIVTEQNIEVLDENVGPVDCSYDIS